MFLSIDIGGTKTLLALFTSFGLCYKRLKFETSEKPADFLSSLKENLNSLLPDSSSRDKLKAITVALPGIVKVSPDGVSFDLPNLPKWHNLDLLKALRNFFPNKSIKIFFANDANLATLYETSRLLRRHGKSAYLTFSTGIGGGLAKNGCLLPSSDTFEPGHRKYSWDGKTLEWEDIASGKALSDSAVHAIDHLKIKRARRPTESVIYGAYLYSKHNYRK